MKKHSRFGSILAALLVSAAAGAAAQQPAAAPSYKFGFVDTQRVMREARAPQQAKMSLDAEFEKRDREIAAGPPGDMERRRNALLEDMSQRRDEVLKQIVDNANAIIRRIAEQEKFDAVFVEAAYANPSIDITAKVIKALDAAR
jgi:outer membrane protein